jgi:hypothetical protein
MPNHYVDDLVLTNQQLEGQCRQWTDSRMRHQPPRYRSLLNFLF